MGNRQQAIDSLSKYLEEGTMPDDDARFIGSVLPKLKRGDITEDMLKDVVMTPVAALLGGLEDIIERLPVGQSDAGATSPATTRRAAKHAACELAKMQRSVIEQLRVRGHVGDELRGWDGGPWLESRVRARSPAKYKNPLACPVIGTCSFWRADCWRPR